MYQIKSFIIRYSLNYAKACNEFVEPISAWLRVRATQLHSKKYCSGGEPLATLCSIWPAQDLNFRSPARETNALPLDQLGGPT